jgi:murein DD-endopeptidase MepM/ murein hydrolase activator NlpD
MDKQGPTNYMKLVVTSSSFSQLIDRVSIVGEIVTSDRKLIDELKFERIQLHELRTQTTTKRQERAEVLTRQQAQKDELVRIQTAQRNAYDYYAALQASLKAQQDALDAQKAQIDAQVVELTRRWEAQGGGSGQFIWPMNPHWVSQGFGCSPVGGNTDYSCPWPHYLHTGIDIAQPYGTPVMAADSGIAAAYYGGYGYGNYVIVVHGGGWATLYAHLSSIDVGTGTRVGKGQVIAREGSTGWSTGPHLHFETRRNGGYSDPCASLPGRC